MKKNIFLIVCYLLVPISVFALKGKELRIIGRLIKYEKEFPWFESTDEYHADGIAPMATFEIGKPKKYVGQQINILFKYNQKKYDNHLLSFENKLNNYYSFTIPEDFFEKDFKIIENILINNFEEISFSDNNILGVVIIDKEFNKKQALIKSKKIGDFLDIWRDRERIVLSDIPEWDHKINFKYKNKSLSWLYSSDQGYCRILTKAKSPYYRIKNFEKLNELMNTND